MRRALAATSAAALLLGAAATTWADSPHGYDNGFAVEPFRNAQQIGALQHLHYGLPALIAERFAQVAPLRFAGRPELFERTAPKGAAWLLGGAYERKADWNVAVTVEIRRAAAPGEVVASVTRVGSKDAVDTTALDAAAAAFGALPGVELDGATLAHLHARFSPDPYAFVLYGRAVGAFHGGGGGPGRAELAAQYLKHALLVEPAVPEARRFMGVALLATGKTGPARAMLSYALDQRDDYALALRSLAVIDRAAGAPSARERYARLVELDPGDVAAHRAYGDLLLEAGHLPEAQRELEAVLAVAPDDAQARRQLVMVLSSRREGNALAAELEEAVKGQPGDLDLQMDLGAAYLALARKAEAANVYAEVLRRRPHHLGALKLAADLARERGDLKIAATYYTRLHVLAPQDPRPVFLLAAAYAEAGDLDRAQRFFDEGGQFPGMLGESFSNLGAIALRRGEPKQALWYLSRAVKKRPQRVVARYNLALALHELGRDPEALDELRAAVALDPADARVRFFAGVVALTLGKVDEATESFKVAVEIDPGNDDARQNLALLERSSSSL